MEARDFSDERTSLTFSECLSSGGRNLPGPDTVGSLLILREKSCFFKKLHPHTVTENKEQKERSLNRMSEKRQTESSNKEAQVAPMLELDEAMREMFGITRMEELWGLKAPALYLKVGTGDIYTDTGACCLPYAKTFTGLQDIAKRYGFAYRPGNAKCGICSTQAEYLLARTVFGAWVPWFGIRKSGEFVACGDTGTLEIRLSITRPELTGNILAEFMEEVRKLARECGVIIDAQALIAQADFWEGAKTQVHSD